MFDQRDIIDISVGDIQNQKGLHNLGRSIMKKMYEAQIFPLVQLIVSKPVIRKELVKATRDGKGTEYFQLFNLGTLINKGQSLLAYDEGLRILGEIKNTSESSFKKIHKGSVYYWLGIAAFYSRDYETAVYFMDSAVSEDLRKDLTLLDTPALLFLLLEKDNPNQYAKGLVEIASQRITSLINLYNNSIGSVQSLPIMSLEGLREQFLKKAISVDNGRLRSLATALISFVLEYELRSQQLNIVTFPATKEPFILHLFKGCLLFESLLKANPKVTPTGNTLNPVIQILQDDLCIGKISTHADSIQDVIKLLPTGQLCVQQAIEIAVKTRNTTGHNLAWDMDISNDNYRKIYECISISIMHSIWSLYKVA
jgi:hypothetical protein